MNGIVEGLRAFAQAFMPLIFTSLAVLVGLLIIMSAVKKMIGLGDARSEPGVTWGSVGMQLLIGALLLQFSSTMNDVSEVLFGTKVQDYKGVLAYMNMPGGAQNFSWWKAVMETVLLWVVFLGWIAAFRGFLKWNEAASGKASGGQDPFWQGLWHIVGGAAAINISGVVGALLG